MNPPARLLAGLAALLGLVLVLEWALPSQPSPAQAVPLARFQSAGRAAVLPTRRTANWAEAILARPVFSISRRPPRIAAGGPASAGPGQARLAGIMITRTGRRAIFAPEGGGHALVLAEGGSINQSTIRRILPDRVVLVSGAVLQPAYDRNRPAATTAFQPPVTPFNPNFPPFPNPGGQFANPGLLTPGVPPPGFQPPGFQPPGFPQQAFQPAGVPVPQPNGEDGVPPTPQQAFHGGLIPQRRE